MPTSDDDVLAADLASDAGDLLLAVRSSAAAELGARGDQHSHRFLIERIAAARPDDRILSEESQRSVPGSGHGRVWIVDPLDGTREFAEAGRDDWAVHVALVVDGRVHAGAVALPARGLTLATGMALPIPCVVDRAPRILVSRTRPAAQAEQLAVALAGELVPMGSAGAKAMAVVLGDADVYAHSGGQYEWDSAAPVAVAAAAGFHVSRLDGTPLVYDRADPWMPDLLVCRPDLAPRVIAEIRRGAG